jgi:hypothetical protein
VSNSEIALTIVVAALSGAGASVLTLVYSSAQERRDRHREHFSRALQTVSQYEEFPYVVRRRRASDPEGERIRISTELRAVQAELSYHCTWLMTESPQVGAAYGVLVAELRRLVGGLIHEAWVSSPVDDDAGMNIADIGPEIAKLRPLKDQYLLEVDDHLSLWPRWLRRAVRSLGMRLTRKA